GARPARDPAPRRSMTSCPASRSRHRCPSPADPWRRSMIDLSNKSAVVTGGSRGIGRAIAVRLATQGADVAFSYRGNEAAAKETAASIEALGRRALPVQADGSDPAAADALINAPPHALRKRP